MGVCARPHRLSWFPGAPESTLDSSVILRLMRNLPAALLSVSVAPPSSVILSPRMRTRIARASIYFNDRLIHYVRAPAFCSLSSTRGQGIGRCDSNCSSGCAGCREWADTLVQTARYLVNSLEAQMRPDYLSFRSAKPAVTGRVARFLIALNTDAISI